MANFLIDIQSFEQTKNRDDGLLVLKTLRPPSSGMPPDAPFEIAARLFVEIDLLNPLSCQRAGTVFQQPVDH